jgi:hypothetical protein
MTHRTKTRSRIRTTTLLATATLLSGTAPETRDHGERLVAVTVERKSLRPRSGNLIPKGGVRFSQEPEEARCEKPKALGPRPLLAAAKNCAIAAKELVFQPQLDREGRPLAGNCRAHDEGY